MEDMIIKKLCNFCMNKNDNCMKYNEYKTKNSSVKIELQNLNYNGQEINKYLSAKIINQ